MTYRINGFDQIKAFYSWVFNNQDKNINTTHISLYVFFINQNNRSNWVEWFKCPYDLGMTGSCIGSRNTYYKCLNDLKEWKLIDFKKGINDYRAPLIKLLMLKSEQVPVPLPEHLPVPLCEHLPEHIYKHITDNSKLITDNEKAFFDFIKNLKDEKEKKEKLSDEIIGFKTKEDCIKKADKIFSNLLPILFENFRKRFPGVKKGFEVEKINFIKKNKPEIVIDLMIGLSKEIEYRDKCLKNNKWVSEWKNLSTWINQKCWEQEFPEIKAEAVSIKKSHAMINHQSIENDDRF